MHNSNLEIVKGEKDEEKLAKRILYWDKLVLPFFFGDFEASEDVQFRKKNFHLVAARL
jgi:hypothetical protein